MLFQSELRERKEITKESLDARQSCDGLKASNLTSVICVHVHTTYVNMRVCVCVCKCILTYMHIARKREREREILFMNIYEYLRRFMIYDTDK